MFESYSDIKDWVRQAVQYGKGNSVMDVLIYQSGEFLPDFVSYVVGFDQQEQVILLGNSPDEGLKVNQILTLLLKSNGTREARFSCQGKAEQFLMIKEIPWCEYDYHSPEHLCFGISSMDSIFSRECRDIFKAAEEYMKKHTEFEYYTIERYGTFEFSLNKTGVECGIYDGLIFVDNKNGLMEINANCNVLYGRDENNMILPKINDFNNRTDFTGKLYTSEAETDSNTHTDILAIVYSLSYPIQVASVPHLFDTALADLRIYNNNLARPDGMNSKSVNRHLRIVKK